MSAEKKTLTVVISMICLYYLSKFAWLPINPLSHIASSAE